MNGAPSSNGIAPTSPHSSESSVWDRDQLPPNLSRFGKSRDEITTCNEPETRDRKPFLMERALQAPVLEALPSPPRLRQRYGCGGTDALQP